MDPQVAQASLDDIRRLQDATRDEEVRRNFALPWVAVTALGLFVGLAATDFDRPWSVVAYLVGFGVYAGVWMMLGRRASVRRKPTGQELLFFLGLSVSLVGLFGIVRIVGWAVFDLPADGEPLSQGTVAAAVVALAYFASTPLTRRAVKAIMRQDGRRG